jgi:uncharacterized FlaG/YvyC family protein
MLNKTDLDQITKIVQSETTKIVQAETTKIVQSETTKIVQSETTKIVQSETTKIVANEIQLFEKRINKRFDKLERKLDYTINFLDRDYLKLLHRVEVIEERLGIEPSTP